ncbi:unnamed protein product [Vitrella brassicaformis CCMP3155]|uniref:Tryptophan synthase beta chain-like PALP domain-containing protein n=1 Tax=Vitrella brassicaformis (strain CCMP3155) TaxID=1169540 RepID=A0A0G4FAF8_VITBC|nr:unnamed protein product [Vitrella brassicaformis CCMP3155]|mmetsp:Transcript_13423/g.32046  ORF Transcript_13423/g.32046 Transcript_13423/m.32046 type:complete len:386 (-) Transcript_13423:91-1248(-)|eukprot:CEM09880.1 unnamed protein product [Vitrella brassicaformis CCMP3155]
MPPALHPYKPPSWAAHLTPPKLRTALAIGAPTPITPWSVPGLPAGVELWIKRDDFTGVELSGNKVRKLEFLMADAVDRGHDSVVTIGGIQSNHCRATAVAARMFGLEPHLILRIPEKTHTDTDKPSAGLTGNLLVDRLMDSRLWLVSKAEYRHHGSEKLLDMVVSQLRQQGKNPYKIPVGGSNALGTWGYIEMVRELEQQLAADPLGITDIVIACGSGGSLAGTALGCHLSPQMGDVRVHGICVCDNEGYFFNHIDTKIYPGMGHVDGPMSRSLVSLVEAAGLGYGISRPEELDTIATVAKATGVILDPVYSGKAVHALLRCLREEPRRFRGSRILFVHTGGLLGMYEKAPQLERLLPEEHSTHYLLPIAETKNHGTDKERTSSN